MLLLRGLVVRKGAAISSLTVTASLSSQCKRARSLKNTLRSSTSDLLIGSDVAYQVKEV
jgi:hypothetical protein